ncbi:Npr3p NDAI_0H00340 [Naumovozyma dairenensis CBS 421]|uniref:Nitrogen permease regulator 3 n=1 Tax=Naumovozyma dairenensis (strain ATCC 10597 / BCRC 20456 / CBS 421 / NBRC 0211 / NRRL Y-12639) TaxID=1071378 RepID=G0WEJ7_NAUDC|nr:hypothetical protein NDAI_0H00340 [Naumovozyma dairenensis CBS 421]CCD26208.1 hypothetical protein NDAI_0H00340 [Naumovozyma dairenensis CBS 421]
MHFLPHSRLIGIHLTISTHSGPQLIYHYPPSSIGNSTYKRNIKKNNNTCGDSSNANSNKKNPKNNTTTSTSSIENVTVDLEDDEFGLSDSDLSTEYASESDSDNDQDKFDTTNTPTVSIPSTSSASTIQEETKQVSDDITTDDTPAKIEDTDEGVNTEPEELVEPSQKNEKASEKDEKAQLPQKKDINDFDDAAINKKSKPEDKIRIKPLPLDDNYFTEENFEDINKIFGFDSDFVAEFCSPEREMCNTRFEFTIDELCFLGLPVHIDSDGKWRKSRHSKRRQGSVKSKKSSSGRSSSSNFKRSRKRSISLHRSKSRRSEDSDPEVADDEGIENNINQNNNNDIVDNGDDKTVEDSVEQVGECDKNNFDKNMNMFHVCFIMNPPLTEYNKKTDDMYQYVVAKLSLLLRYVQAKDSYVSKQCNLILKERERVLKFSQKYKSIKGKHNKAKYLYRRILEKSSLAKSLTECVHKLQKNQIACLDLGNRKIVSLQVPVENEFQILPNFKITPAIENCYLTSILNNSFLERLSLRADGLTSTTTGTNAGTSTDWRIENDVDDETNRGRTSNNNNNRSSNIKYQSISDGKPTNPMALNRNTVVTYYSTGDSEILEMNNNDLLNYSILLLDDPTNIIQSLEESSNQDVLGNTILRHLVKRMQPNIPIRNYQYIIDEVLGSGFKSGITDNTIQCNILRSCTLHLIYWRYARVILPISSKSFYIVSPVSSVSYSKENESKFVTDSISFKEKFPLLPTLENMLSIISNNGTGKVECFNNIIPTREHKPTYLGALAWLIRYGYVTPLLSFIYIRVDKKIKMTVEEDLEREGFKKKNANGLQRNINRSSMDNAVDQKEMNTDNDLNQMTETFGSNVTIDETLKNTSIPNERGSNLNDGQNDDNMNDDLHFEYDDPELQKDYTIILDPERATAIEKRWIFKCIADQPPDVQILFNRLLKYFNGKVPMELVLTKEGISRNELKKLFNVMDKYLVEVRHW